VLKCFVHNEMTATVVELVKSCYEKRKKLKRWCDSGEGKGYNDGEEE